MTTMIKRETQTIDTADRLRPGDQIKHNGQWLLVADITDASTTAMPSRYAILAVDPHGQAFSGAGQLLLIQAGNTVTYRPGAQRSRRPHATSERTQVRPACLGYEVLNADFGAWTYIGAGLPAAGMWNGCDLIEASDRTLSLLAAE